jgi:pyruvate/2-oxoglutarate/acetoin dehydrogenase E1 component
MRYQKALVEAVADEMKSDDSVVYLGEDVVHALRGISAGLHDTFGDRVRDLPISEAAFTGLATGAAIVGKRPIVEYQIPTLLYVAFDQIVNQAQKIRLMTGGQVKVPVTYLFPGSGNRLGLAGQHSDHPYTLLVHAGVKTVVPSTAADAYGLLRSAIRDDDPVAVFAPAACLPVREEVDGTIVPLGQGRIHREGTDVTVVAIGSLVAVALRCAESLAEQGISLEVWDPRSLLPFDYDGLAESVRRTRRLVVLDDSNRMAGFGAEVAAFAAEELFDVLDAAVVRVSRANVTVPFAVPLELTVVPSVEQLTRAVMAVLGKGVSVG